FKKQSVYLYNKMNGLQRKMVSIKKEIILYIIQTIKNNHHNNNLFNLFSQKKIEKNSADDPASVSYYNALCEAKNAQKTIKDLERKVNELQNEADKTKQMTTETMNINKNHV